MKIQIKQHINRFTFYIFLTAIFWITGCSAPKPTPDPLAGWKVLLSKDSERLNQAIIDDYKDYIRDLPPNERHSIGVIDFLEDGTGQHAVRFEIALNGTDWAYVLIYNKYDKRIKVIKYVSGYYRS